MPLSRAQTARRAALALLPLLILPAGAHAAGPILSAASATGTPRSTDVDQIISPGETFDLVTKLTNSGSGDFPGGYGGIANSDQLVSIAPANRGFAEENQVVSNDPDPDGDPSTPAPDSGTGYGVAPFAISLASNYQCGKNVSLGLTIVPVQGNNQGPFDFTIPTGAAGALRTYQDNDGGGTLLEAGKVESTATVPAAAAGDSVSDFVRGVRIHIDTLSYKYTPHWFKIQLVSPEGKVATLYDDTAVDRQLYPGQDVNFENKTYNDLTFVSKGDPAGVALGAGNLAAFKDGAVIQANDDLAAVLSGTKRSGNWTLRVVDVPSPGTPRIGTRDGSGTSSRAISSRDAATTVIGQVGDWQLGVNGAVCSTTPNTGRPNPDAWFGGADPLIVAPGGSPTISASASTSYGSGSSISSYKWDTHTGTGTADFTTPDATGNPLTLSSPTRGTKTVKLKVTDSNGASGTATRTVIVSEKPSVDAITAEDSVTHSPNPSAGNLVNLSADVSDSAGADKITQPNKVTWDLDGDGTFDTNTTAVAAGSGSPNAATATTTTTFQTAGVHVVRVKVTNDLGVSTIKTLAVSTANLPPIARLGVVGFADTATAVVGVGQTITFDGSKSADPDGTIAVYEWNPDMGNSSRYTSTQTTPSFATSYHQAGIYEVHLKVTDNIGDTDDVFRTIKVSGTPLAVIKGNAIATTGTTLTYTGTDSSDDGSIANWDWDLDNNGTFETPGSTVSKAFPNAGNVTFKLRVTDDDGLTNVTAFTVRVSAPGSGNTGNGGGTNPTPTPTPKPTQTPGVLAPPSDVIKTPETAKGTTPGTQTAGTDPSLLTDPFREGTPPSDGSTPSGFRATMSAASKVKASKVYKKGFAAALKVNGASTLVVKVMISKKDAKAIGIKSKVAQVAIGSGKLTIKKSGSAKFTVVFVKKFQKNVKKAKKVTLTLRAVINGPNADDQLALARKVMLVK